MNNLIPLKEIVPSNEILKIRELRKNKSIDDSDYEKFWKRPDNVSFLEKKSDIERFNRDAFLYYWDIFKTNKDNEIVNKLSIYRKFIIDYNKREPIFPCYVIDFNKFPFKDNQDTFLDSVNAQFKD